MASRSPVEGEEHLAYENGWAALTELMKSGKSWSGHERNCCYANVGDGRFADVSAAVGLDFLDDGRALAVSDWDADGDLDIWLKNRTGPQLRLMMNRGADQGHFIQLKLTGKSCNRSAVGATVIATANGRRLRRDVIAGDGYLAQSSKWLHFGLGSETNDVKLAVRWPGGVEETFDSVQVDRRYTLTQGGSLVVVPRRKPPSLATGPLTPPGDKDGVRIVLRTPLQLPSEFVDSVTGQSERRQAVLINLWAQWCVPCRAELHELAEYVESFANEGLQIVPLNVDEPSDRKKASDMLAKIAESHGVAEALTFRTADDDVLGFLEVVLTHVREKRDDKLPLPVSLLIDPSGSLQIVYLGKVDAESVLADYDSFIRRSRPGPFRGSFPGRWYFGVPRNLSALAKALRSRGLQTEAAHYQRLLVAERLLQRQ